MFLFCDRTASFTWIQMLCFWTWEVWLNTTALVSYLVMTVWCFGVLMATPHRGDVTGVMHWLRTNGFPHALGFSLGSSRCWRSSCLHAETESVSVISSHETCVESPLSECLVGPYNPRWWIWWSFLFKRSELVMLWKLSTRPAPSLKLLLLPSWYVEDGHELRGDLKTTSTEKANLWQCLSIHLWQGILKLTWRHYSWSQHWCSAKRFCITCMVDI